MMLTPLLPLLEPAVKPLAFLFLAKKITIYYDDCMKSTLTNEDLLNSAPQFWGEKCAYCDATIVAGDYAFYVIDYYAPMPRWSLKKFLKLFKKPRREFRKIFCTNIGCESQTYGLANTYIVDKIYVPQLVKNPITGAPAYLTPQILEAINRDKVDPRTH